MPWLWWRPKAATLECSPKTAGKARFVNKGEQYSMRTHPFNFGALYCILGLNLTPPPWGAAPGGEGKEGNQGDRKTIEVMETVACPQNPA